MRKLVFTQYADAQYSDAYLWYEGVRSGIEIFYDFDASTIVVYAVFHTSQHPDNWQSQLN